MGPISCLATKNWGRKPSSSQHYMGSLDTSEWAVQQENLRLWDISKLHLFLRSYENVRDMQYHCISSSLMVVFMLKLCSKS